MKNARPDYDRIQDPAGHIPADDPLSCSVLKIGIRRLWRAFTPIGSRPKVGTRKSSLQSAATSR